jgi:hypothetical protein
MPFGLATARGSDTDTASGGGDEPDAEPLHTQGTVTWGDDSSTGGVDATTSASMTGGSDSSGGESSSSTGAPLPLPCDPGFSFDPAEPTTATFYVIATHEDPLAYVDLTVVGPNTAEATYVAVVAEDPWQWRWRVTGHVAGVYTFSFGNAASEGGPVTVHSTCQREVVD